MKGRFASGTVRSKDALNLLAASDVHWGRSSYSTSSSRRWRSSPVRWSSAPRRCRREPIRRVRWEAGTLAGWGGGGGRGRGGGPGRGGGSPRPDSGEPPPPHNSRERQPVTKRGLYSPATRMGGVDDDAIRALVTRLARPHPS